MYPLFCIREELQGSQTFTGQQDNFAICDLYNFRIAVSSSKTDLLTADDGEFLPGGDKYRLQYRTRSNRLKICSLCKTKRSRRTRRIGQALGRGKRRYCANR